MLSQQSLYWTRKPASQGAWNISVFQCPVHAWTNSSSVFTWRATFTKLLHGQNEDEWSITLFRILTISRDPWDLVPFLPGKKQKQRLSQPRSACCQLQFPLDSARIWISPASRAWLQYHHLHRTCDGVAWLVAGIHWHGEGSQRRPVGGSSYFDAILVEDLMHTSAGESAKDVPLVSCRSSAPWADQPFLFDGQKDQRKEFEGVGSLRSFWGSPGVLLQFPDLAWSRLPSQLASWSWGCLLPYYA